MVQPNTVMPETPAALVDIQKVRVMCEQLLALARRRGAEAAKVIITWTQGFQVEVHDQQPEQVSFLRDKQVNFTVYRDHRPGTVSTSEWSSDCFESWVNSALAMSALNEADPHVGLVDPEYTATEQILDKCHAWPLTVEKAIEQAQIMERAVRVDRRIRASEGAEVGTRWFCMIYADTLGRFYPMISTQHHRSVIAVAQEASGGLERDWFVTQHCDPHELDGLETVAERAAQRAIDRLGARSLPTQKGLVYFDPRIASTFLETYFTAISGRLIYRRESFLMDALDQRCFPSWCSMEQQPWLRKDRYSGWFDREGMPITPQLLVHEGICRSYLLDVYSARRLNQRPTGHANGLRRTHVTATHETQTELFKTFGSGLYVTEMMGDHTNWMRGDFSSGVTGFWIDQEHRAFPVKNVTIAGALPELFQQWQGMSSDWSYEDPIRVGTLAVDGWTIAGSS